MTLTVDRYYCWRIGGPVEGAWFSEGEHKCPECGGRNHTKLKPGTCGKFIANPKDERLGGDPCELATGHTGPCQYPEEQYNMDKLICQICGCLFPSEDYSSPVCLDCAKLTPEIDTAAHEKALAQKRLKQVQRQINSTQEIIRAIWDTRGENPGWYLTLPGWCVTLRALYASERILLAIANDSPIRLILSASPWTGTAPNSGRVSPDLR